MREQLFVGFVFDVIEPTPQARVREFEPAVLRHKLCDPRLQPCTSPQDPGPESWTRRAAASRLRSETAVVVLLSLRGAIGFSS